MRKKIILLTLPVLIPLLLFVGCATDRNAVQRKEVPPMTLSEQGITVTLSYLTEDKLVERFGERDNPFIFPPSGFGLNSGFIFELAFNSDINADIMLNKIELQYEGKAKVPKNIFHFSNYWDMKLDEKNAPKKNLAKMKLVIKKNLLPNQYSIKSGSSHKKLIAFTGKLPRYGNFTVFVPVYDENGKLIHNFRYSFEL